MNYSPTVAYRRPATLQGLLNLEEALVIIWGEVWRLGAVPVSLSTVEAAMDQHVGLWASQLA